MGEIVDLFQRRKRVIARRGFESWLNRFRMRFDENTSARGLDNAVLKYLIRGGEESAVALYDLIMGITGLGPGRRFQYLDSEAKMNVTDITLFLLDQFRFEAMYRLGWIDDYPFLSAALLDLVQGFARFGAARYQCPSLTPAHPMYSRYLDEFEGDRGSFIRRLIPDAIQKFYAEE